MQISYLLNVLYSTFIKRPVERRMAVVVETQGQERTFAGRLMETQTNGTRNCSETVPLTKWLIRHFVNYVLMSLKTSIVPFLMICVCLF